MTRMASKDDDAEGLTCPDQLWVADITHAGLRSRLEPPHLGWAGRT